MAIRVTYANARNPSALHKILDELRVQSANHRAAIVGITAKLDADGGVTDTDFAALWNPAALLTLTADPPTNDPTG